MTQNKNLQLQSQLAANNKHALGYEISMVRSNAANIAALAAAGNGFAGTVLVGQKPTGWVFAAVGCFLVAFLLSMATFLTVSQNWRLSKAHRQSLTPPASGVDSEEALRNQFDQSMHETFEQNQATVRRGRHIMWIAGLFLVLEIAMWVIANATVLFI